ncbi:MAG TPA: sensor histidine kinase [Gemmatimonadaceae bacterium]|nr:sensor histidine kinase [Gemmatimonadaceae bacterium]
MATLPDFIRGNTEPILSEWETFARSLPLGETLDIAALRDHAKEMLRAVAEDLSEPQTGRQQSEKSRGQSDAGQRLAPTAAQAHGAGRAESGFSIEQMVSEFRALRASVIRLWTVRKQKAGVTDLQDMIRFNEAIDQAIAESIATYTRDVRESKDRFLAILGHDLRTPIGAMVMSTKFMLDTGELSETQHMLMTRMEATARRMNRLVADLLEFTRTRFGDAIPIDAVNMDIARMVEDVASEVRASYPASVIEVKSSGDLQGNWDLERLAQALTNLVSNAVQHGAEGSPVQIEADGSAEEVVISVRNHGTPMTPEQIDHVFERMKAFGAPEGHDRRHLGLGLYIVDKIVRAHKGSIAVESSAEQGTNFMIHLPRAQ